MHTPRSRSCNPGVPRPMPVSSLGFTPACSRSSRIAAAIRPITASERSCANVSCSDLKSMRPSPSTRATVNVVPPKSTPTCRAFMRLPPHQLKDPLCGPCSLRHRKGPTCRTVSALTWPVRGRTHGKGTWHDHQVPALPVASLLYDCLLGIFVEDMDLPHVEADRMLLAVGRLGVRVDLGLELMLALGEVHDGLGAHGLGDVDGRHDGVPLVAGKQL